MVAKSVALVKVSGAAALPPVAPVMTVAVFAGTGSDVVAGTQMDNLCVDCMTGPLKLTTVPSVKRTATLH